MLFAYFGPETSLPLASAAAALVGFVVMTGRVSLKFVTRRFWFFKRK